MKKVILSVLLLAAPFMTFAQLKVTSSGKVCIGVTDTPVSDFAVGGVGLSTTANYFESNKTYLMNLKCIGDTATPSNFTTRTGLRITRTTNTIGSFTGVSSNMQQSYAGTNGTTIGILGIAGNANTNYGVNGRLQGSKKGAAVIGQVSGNNIDIDRQYAGYFAGDVGVTKDLFAEGVYESSDSRFLMGQSALDSAIIRLETLTPVKWAWPSQVQGNDPRAYTRYAISGQNMEQEFPLLVRSAPNTYRYVDYVGLIPVLVQAIKDLNSRIEELEANLRSSEVISNLQMNPIVSGMEKETAYPNVSLRQSMPNSFNGEIEIGYTLPYDATNACICIFDMKGILKKRVSITSTDDRVTIDTGALPPGIYLYSLIVNGHEVDTKRMTVSK